MKNTFNNVMQIIALLIAIFGVLYFIHASFTGPSSSEAAVTIGDTAVGTERFTLDGHAYICFDFGTNDHSVVHDPDCPACTGQKEDGRKPLVNLQEHLSLDAQIMQLSSLMEKQ